MTSIFLIVVLSHPRRNMLVFDDFQISLIMYITEQMCRTSGLHNSVEMTFLFGSFDLFPWVREFLQH